MYLIYTIFEKCCIRQNSREAVDICKLSLNSQILSGNLRNLKFQAFIYLDESDAETGNLRKDTGGRGKEVERVVDIC